MATWSRALPRALAVLDPVRLTLTSWNGPDEELDLPWWPAEPGRGGTRKVPFGRDLLVERDDFSLRPASRLEAARAGARGPARRGRAWSAATRSSADRAERWPEIRCSFDPASRDGGGGRRGLGTIHWVHASRSVPAEVRLYDRLFTVEQPDAAGNFLDVLNPDSLSAAPGARVEPALRDAPPGTHWQFLRQGYFFVDPVDSRPGRPGLEPDHDAQGHLGRPGRSPPGPRRPARPARETLSAPPRKGRGDARAEQRAADPALAALHARLAATPGVSDDQADLLSTDVATAAWFDAAVAAGAPPGPTARWLLNELLGLASDTPLASLPLPAADFGRFVALAESGRVTGAGAKTLLASLVGRPGDPAARLAELGLEKVDDRAVARWRGGPGARRPGRRGGALPGRREEAARVPARGRRAGIPGQGRPERDKEGPAGSAGLSTPTRTRRTSCADSHSASPSSPPCWLHPPPRAPSRAASPSPSVSSRRSRSCPESQGISGFRFSLLYGNNAFVNGFDLGLVNMTSGGAVGVQWGAVSIVNGEFKGWQGNWIVSITGGNFEGLQTGLYNQARHVKGLQLGIVNQTETMEGVQIGLVNIIHKGGMLPVFPFFNFSFK